MSEAAVIAHQRKAEMNTSSQRRGRRRRASLWLAPLAVAAAVGTLAPVGSTPSQAATSGAAEGLVCQTNPSASFVLTAKEGYITTPDLNSVYMWSYSGGSDPFQYPGVVLCVNEGDNVTITLRNTLKVSTSIMFPGINSVRADGVLAQPELTTNSLTKSAPAGGVVTYTFNASHAGTYLYESGTNPELQDQMGLTGVLIVRPRGFTDAAPYAYNLAGDTPDTNTSYKPGKEFLNFLSEVDPDLHQKVEFAPDQGAVVFDMTDYRPKYFMNNGRVFPDDTASNYSASLYNPTTGGQPYSALVHIQPRSDAPGIDNNPLPAIVRFVDAGPNTYPFHPHGNHDKVIAIDGRALRANDLPGGTNDLTSDRFSIVMVPGQTADVLVSWVDAQGWDPATNRIGPDVPNIENRANGAYWSGSPYLGELNPLLPGETQFNECGEFYHVAHPHNLVQVSTYSTAMSGMLTMTRVDPPNSVQQATGIHCHVAGEL
jgi:hypothetical protein